MRKFVFFLTLFYPPLKYGMQLQGYVCVCAQERDAGTRSVRAAAAVSGPQSSSLQPGALAAAAESWRSLSGAAATAAAEAGKMSATAATAADRVSMHLSAFILLVARLWRACCICCVAPLPPPPRR